MSQTDAGTASSSPLGPKVICGNLLARFTREIARKQGRVEAYNTLRGYSSDAHHTPWTVSLRAVEPT